MSQNFLKSLILVSIIFSFFSIITGCDSAPDEPAWHTVFSDNFNRVDGELGSNWNVIPETNGTLTISGNRALYSTTGTTDNSIAAYPYNGSGIDSNKIKLSFKFTTDSNFDDIETIGFLFKPSPETGKQYCLTFKYNYLALGTKNSDAAAWTWLETLNPNLLDNTTYYLELYVDGSSFTGRIKNAGGAVMHEIKITGEDYSSWNTYFILMSNGNSSAIQFDDYTIKAYY